MISERTLPSRARPAERGLTVSLNGSWHRIALLATVALSAALNFIGLSREGYNNEFYAAAVRSRCESARRHAERDKRARGQPGRTRWKRRPWWCG